ncbi:hypothetical protein EZS27_042160, partial [termite gut metagenome]
MSEQTLIPLNHNSFRFRLQMLFPGNYALTGLPVITGNILHLMVIYGLTKCFGCLVASVSNNEVEESFPIAVYGNPYPAVVFFEPVQECISST